MMLTPSYIEPHNAGFKYTFEIAYAVNFLMLVVSNDTRKVTGVSTRTYGTPEEPIEPSCFKLTPDPDSDLTCVTVNTQINSNLIYVYTEE